MSHDSYLCGYIKLSSGIEKAQAALDKLPSSSDGDDWPFLTKTMFSYTPSPEYRDRILHFAASYKDILGSWLEWELKFEKFIAEIDYDDIKIIVEDCYYGDFIFNWRNLRDKEGKVVIEKEQKQLDYTESENIKFGKRE